MRIFVINAGSSSIKYQLFDMSTNLILGKGMCERIGLPKSRIIHRAAGREIVRTMEIADHTMAIAQIFEILQDKTFGVIKSLQEIDAVGHRVLHGGAVFSDSVLITDEVIKAIEENIPLGPLHNPANLAGIQACRKLLPNMPMAAVFDTAFHQTLPRKAFLYALPYDYYQRLKIRKYGFHGTSYRYAAEKAAETLNKSQKELKMVICHLGNGASVCAIDKGQCVDTSMGLTPLEGLVMGTRSGDLDPAIVEFICRRDGKTVEEVFAILNRKSGLLGLSDGLSSDSRDIEDAMHRGDDRGIRAVEVFTYRIRKYIGAYAAVMNGLDVIAFTGGIGEHSPDTRSMVLKDLQFFGIEIDEALNQKNAPMIHGDSSRVKALIIPANEELAIAQETYRLVSNPAFN